MNDKQDGAFGPEAAATIRDLQAKLGEAREAIRPFALWAEFGPSREYLKSADDNGMPANTPHTAGQYRLTRTTLARIGG